MSEDKGKILMDDVDADSEAVPIDVVVPGPEEPLGEPQKDEFTDAELHRAEQIESLPISSEAKDKLLETPDEEYADALINVVTSLSSNPTTGPEVGTKDSEEVPHKGNYDVPRIDIDESCKRFASALDSGDNSAAVEEFRRVVDHSNSYGQLLLEAINEQDTVTMPSRVRNAVSGVQGATDKDVVGAVENIMSGRTSDPETALQLAAFDRMSSKKSPSSDARTKAKARLAKQRGGPVRTEKPSTVELTEGVQCYEEAFRRAGGDLR